jgi:hypothetical protein
MIVESHKATEQVDQRKNEIVLTKTFTEVASTCLQSVHSNIQVTSKVRKAICCFSLPRKLWRLV